MRLTQAIRNLRLCGAAFIVLACAMRPAAAADKVLVFGASGQLGSEIAKALVAHGDKVVAFVRPSSSPERLAGLPVEAVTGDVMIEADVERALKDVRPTVVIDALARGRAEVSFYEVAERHIAAWAKATGVRQVILHSSIGAGASRAIYPAERLPAMAPVLDAKGAGEQHLIASGVTYTIIRNGALLAPVSDAPDHATLIADEHQFGAVTRPALARLTVNCLGNPACANKIFHAIDPTLEVPAGRIRR